MNLENIDSNTISLVSNVPSEYRNKFLKRKLMLFKNFLNNVHLLVALLAWQSPTKNCHHVIENVSKDVGISKNETYVIIGAYIEIVKLFLQSSSEFNSRLTEIGFSTDFITNLSLAENQHELLSNLKRHSINNFSKISILKWKIDISLIDRYKSQLFKIRWLILIYF